MGLQRPHTPPANIMLQLSDGTISANRESLASFSPVFERMFNGEFKEKKSSLIPLPTDKHKTIKQLFDIIYKGGCEIDSLDDIDTLMEVVDRYDFNKAPFLQMFDEAILSQMDSSNYLMLLPKYVSVMSEEGHKKAADKVISFTNNDFVTKFDQTKDLPEEILLILLEKNDIRSHEVDIFRFLIEWQNHQTENLGKDLQKLPQLFNCVRYSLIIPQFLSSVVAKCNLVDGEALKKAFQYLYGSCKPIGEDDEAMQAYFNQGSRRPNCSLKVEWLPQHGVTFMHNNEEAGHSKVEYHREALGDDHYVLMSTPLRNGVYSFRIFQPSLFGFWGSPKGMKSKKFKRIQSNKFICIEHKPISTYDDVSMVVIDRHGKHLGIYVLEDDGLVTIYVHDNCMFVKHVGGGKVLSTLCIDACEDSPFRLCIRNDKIQNKKIQCSRYGRFSEEQKRFDNPSIMFKISVQ